MKAAVNDCYGSPDVLEIREIPTPVPKAGEILVRVYATTVGRTDSCALRAHPFFMRPQSGLLRPKRNVLGLDFAGTVVAVGKGTTQFSIDDRVFGVTPDGNGAHAEYVCLLENSMVGKMPMGKRFSEVVVGEGAWYANTYLKIFGMQNGQTILIYGASGAIGTAAVQIAKIYGADVTAVVSGPHVELLKELGADRVVDYTVEDFTEIGASFDFVLDAVGKTTFFRCRPLLKPQGVYSATDLGPGWQNIFLALWSSLTGTGRVVMPMPRSDRPFIEFLRTRMQAGEFNAVIDRTYSLQDIAAAYRYVETEKKAGIVVINVAPVE